MARPPLMHPDVTSLLVVGGDPDLHAMIQVAATRAFSNPAVTVIHQFPERLELPVPSPVDLLVLVDLGPVGEAGFLAVAGSPLAECPRLRLGAAARQDEIESVPPEEWNVPLLARVFRSTVTQHELLRERARAHGDLLTLGRRFCHDLRTPLGGILTSVEALEEVLTEEAPARVALVQLIAESAHDLVGIIGRVSQLVTASVSPVSMTPFPMEQAVLAALEKLEVRLIHNRAILRRPALWPTMEGVAPWLEVVWWNLIANAVQHAGTSPRIGIGWDPGEDEYRFWVRDNGPGVPPEKLGRLFQPFHELYKPGSARGLGLPIVRRLLELQGGRWGYETLAGGGAGFHFTLPCRGVSRALPPMTEANRRGARDLRPDRTTGNPLITPH